MTRAGLSATEDAELTLIQRDANELALAMRTLHAHQDSGLLSYAITPLLGFVAEESFRYLSGAAGGSNLRPPVASLFSRFAHAVTKTRARVKLFDDTDGYSEGLIELLVAAQAKSVEHFSSPHQGRWRSWVRIIQPDLGVYFVGENLFATTHTGLPGMGLTTEEVKALSTADFKKLGERNFAIAFEIGVYLRQLAAYFESFGKHIVLTPAPRRVDVRATYNDFIGAKAYRVAAERFRPSEPRFVGPIIMALAQFNSALHVLPHLLGENSNLLFRYRVLSAYHGANVLTATGLQEVARAVPLSDAEAQVLRSRRLRNLCAHYGLRRDGPAAVGQDDIWGAAIHHATGATRSDVSELAARWLSCVSQQLATGVSKSSLAPIRAFFGCHS